MSPWMTERLNTLKTENQPERPALRIPAPRPALVQRPERRPESRPGAIIVDLTIA